MTRYLVCFVIYIISKLGRTEQVFFLEVPIVLIINIYVFRVLLCVNLHEICRPLWDMEIYLSYGEKCFAGAAVSKYGCLPQIPRLGGHKPYI